MRKLIVTTFVSLDGVMQAPGGEPGYAHTGWVGDRFSEELAAYKLEEQLAAGVLLLGRRTYESFHGAWPQREGPMAEKINTMRKLVASTTLEASPWHDTEVVATDLLGHLERLKREEDGAPILVVGSRSVAQALLTAGLVDELHLQVFPLVLGSGDRLFPASEDLVPLELISSEATPNGVLLQEYRPRR
jgi:dihydrofolate reductase